MKNRSPKTRLHNRPWLLLWLLPFLLLNVAGEALHNHPLSSVSHAVSGSSWTAPDDGHRESLPGDMGAEASCLSCQWHANSQGQPSETALLVAPRITIVRPPLAASRWASHFATHSRNRGPPHSFA